MVRRNAAAEPVALHPGRELLRASGHDIEVTVEDDRGSVAGGRPSLGHQHRHVVVIVLADLDTERYDLYAHQNEDIVRLTPQQLKERMAAKEAGGGG